MSLEPKALAKQIEARANEQRRAREQEGIQPILAEMSISAIELPDGKALGALLRNSLASDAEPPAVGVTVKLSQVGISLERDGCDYVHMGLRFLQHFGCPPQCRLFVLAVCAVTGGDAHSFHVVPDIRVAELIGYERHAVKPIREALIEWQRETNYAFIDIVEGDYDRTQKKHVATQYRARIVPLIGRFVRDARAMSMRSGQSALRLAAEKGYDEVIDDIAKETPTAPLVRRREAQRGKGKTNDSAPIIGRQIEMFYSRRDRWKESGEDLFGSVLMAGQNPWPIFETAVAELTESLERMTRNYPEYQRE